MKLKFADTGSTVQTPNNSQGINSSSENSKTPTVAAHRPPLSLIPAAPAITPAHTPRTIHIPDQSDFFPLSSLPPPPLAETVAKKQNLSNIESQFLLHSVIKKQPLLCKIKLLNHLLLRMYLI